MKRLHRLLAALSILSLANFSVAAAAGAFDVTPVSDPETLGLSPSRLARLAAWQQTQVDAGVFSGAVAAIARNGQVTYLQAVGFRDRAKTIPLQNDAIFWIASMTKPVTSVAAMMLVEEGKLDSQPRSPGIFPSSGERQLLLRPGTRRPARPTSHMSRRSSQ
jgi:CubicO group peptidase (beta-lactamase class C family)